MQKESIEVRGLRKLYETRGGVGGGIRDATFHLPAGSFFTLLGPSGCGKTTTLRCIAGLEQPDAGLIKVGEEVFFDGSTQRSIALNQRRIGMVFQSYAVWPHMTVFENVSFPLRVARDRKFTRSEVDTMTRKALATVDLAELGERSATRLSGGQQQRVALARAIVREPRVLLLDEPLSNLDASLRDSMRVELKRLQQRIGVTTVYVTHDQTEALEMSDQIAVINRGEVVQIGAPRDIYFRPCNAFVAGFVGTTNLLQGKVAVGGGAGAAASVECGEGVVLMSCGAQSLRTGQQVSLSIRPESIRLLDQETAPVDGQNCVTGQVASLGFLGHVSRYEVSVAGCLFTVHADSRTDVRVGDTVILGFAVSDTILLTE